MARWRIRQFEVFADERAVSLMQRMETWVLIKLGLRRKRTVHMRSVLDSIL